MLYDYIYVAPRLLVVFHFLIVLFITYLQLFTLKYL